MSPLSLGAVVRAFVNVAWSAAVEAQAQNHRCARFQIDLLAQPPRSGRKPCAEFPVSIRTISSGQVEGRSMAP